MNKYDKEIKTVFDMLNGAFDGGKGSGNFGHAGRPGKVGGSAPESGGPAAGSNDFDEIDRKAFIKKLTAAKESMPESMRWRVDIHTEEEYAEKNAKCFSTEGGSVFAVTGDGDIISVCKNANDTMRGAGARMLEEAVKRGGKKLDSFAGNHNFYAKNGFEPVSWTPFNEEYAPEGWATSGAPKEPVIFYKYVGKGNVKNADVDAFTASVKPFTGPDGYDNAMKKRDGEL